MKPRNVVVTGIGTVNGLGMDSRSFWRRLIQGESAIGPVMSFDTTGWRTHIGCEIRGVLPQTGHPDRVYDLLMSAAVEAIAQAGDLPTHRTGVVIATLQGGLQTLETVISSQVRESQDVDISSVWPVYSLSGQARYVASAFNFRGPVASSVIACAASGAAIGRALDFIRLDHADAMVTGGADAFCRITYAGFNAIRSAAPTQCRPFSLNREGLVIGEGAGVLVLEAEETARRRGAHILARVLGVGLADDAYHITSPEPEGRGAVHAMRAALDNAGLAPEAIDYINAHGTGTPANDAMETRALKSVFQSAADHIPVSSIKAAVGHCMGAAGAVEAVASVLALQHQEIPPTLNFVPGDPVCTLDYVPQHSRPWPMRAVLSNSFGFAGNNACVIFGSMDPEGPVQA